MASRGKKAWADLSSEFSSSSDGSRAGRQSVLTGLPDPSDPSMDRDTFVGGGATVQTEEDIDITELSVAPNPNEANARFYQELATFEPSTTQPDATSTYAIPEKHKRHLGPVDLSTASHPSGLADIRLPKLPWRGRQPPGIRIPTQLIDFGKYNLRYEVQRDLESEDTFDRELADGEQSWVANHYFDHLVMAEEIAGHGVGGGGGSDLFPVRPPSPSLPKDVAENLQIRTSGMVQALMQARAERDEFLRRETELILEEKALTERLKGLDEQTRTLTWEKDRLREEYAENDIDAGQVGLFSSTGGTAFVVDGDIRSFAADVEVNPSRADSGMGLEDGVLSLERESSIIHSKISEIVLDPVANMQRAAQGSQVMADVVALTDEEQLERRTNLLRGGFDRINLQDAD